jgi:hypothetical protein
MCCSESVRRCPGRQNARAGLGRQSMRSVSQGMCIPFRLRQADMGTANYEGTQCLTCNLPAPDAVVTGNSKYARSTAACIIVSERSYEARVMSDVRNCRNPLGIVNGHGAERSMRTPSSRELSRRSSPRVEESGKTGFNSAKKSIAGNQTQPRWLVSQRRFSLRHWTAPNN